MGNFGIQFSDNFSRPKPVSEIQEELDQTSEGFFQKSLAYSSYYMMIFVAYCVVTPEKVEVATNLVANLFA